MILACRLSFGLPATAGEHPRIAIFRADATPPIGRPVAYVAATKILDPLSARGIVILSDQPPIVLCAVDWLGISNEGRDAWRTGLAQAAGTTPQRVAVHCLHQHDTPRCDFSSERLLAKHGQAGKHFDVPFAEQVIARTATSIRKALEGPRTVTHLGVGIAAVQQVASNRRLLGSDGSVKLMRWSKSRNPEAIAAPEGLIDPRLRAISFWNEDIPLCVLTYYATHPQSYYGQGEVTTEFVGLARAARETDTGIPHIHFNGAGGNVAAGKYNDGSAGMRPVLTRRLATGMRAAWESTRKQPLTDEFLEWRVETVNLPVSQHLLKSEQHLRATLADTSANVRLRLGAASHLAWLERCQAGHGIDLACLRLGSTWMVHMPGELFVEYQLAAQQLRLDDTVCMAAYGEYGPGYIGTEIAYGQGGYETSPAASRVAPQSEAILRAALDRLLADDTR